MVQIIVTLAEGTNPQPIIDAAKTVPGITSVELVSDAEARRMAMIRAFINMMPGLGPVPAGSNPNK